MAEEKNQEKSQIALREEETLKFWNDQQIFQKSLKKPSPQGEFVFYDGPPFATGQPHYGHLLAGTMKDVIPRFKTMQGYHVPRVWGWDCHGLPIENLVEKELDLKSKRDIEEYGIEKFNEAARTRVLRYDADWKRIIPRTGRWIDMDLAYLTMSSTYSESIWWSFKSLFNKNLIYQGFKVMHICPHCETTLSNFEVTQGYKDITDISVYVKFELVDEPGTYVVAWTTTPWTLPGNVALAVHPKISYVKIKLGEEKFIVAKERLTIKPLSEQAYEVLEEFSGKELIGKKYKPVFDYYINVDLKNKDHAWKIVGADFVTTTDGTGIVHIAPGYGEDDYNLSLKENLPFIQHVGMDGKFKKEVIDFVGMSAKPKDSSENPTAHQSTDIEIIKYLAGKATLFAKEKIVHSYPHCWRCDTPLLNYAASSWFVKVTDLKDTLVAENKKVNWVPSEIGEGRFGKWLEGAKDWAISRSRFWGAPLPVWICKECGKQEVIGSLDEIKVKTRKNTYYVFRHGEGDHNVANIMSSRADNPHHLTENGIEEVRLSSQALKDVKVDVIITSPFVRTKETADVIVEQIAYKGPILQDDRLGEFNFGDFNLKSLESYHAYFETVKEKLTKRLPHGECINDLRTRVGEFLYDVDSKYEGKTIVLVTHDSPATMLFAAAEGANDARALDLWGLDRDFLSPGQEAKLDFAYIPHNRMYELDLHRPYIDEVVFSCSCGGLFKRVPEVFDTWYESGSMPYSQLHYPFENKNLIDAKKQFPADFIAEGQDQTRGWFYSLLVLSTGLFGHTPYKNVIVNGIVLAEDGQKMSKRLQNYPDVEYVLNKYGADALRYYVLSSPAVRAEDLAFSEKGLDEVVKKLMMRLQNVYTFYATYASETEGDRDPQKSNNVLDQWIIARLNELGTMITTSLEKYELDRASRPCMNFIDDLSTWYLRRSRDRFKGDNQEDKQFALATIRFVLFEFSKLIAPFMPFIAEDLYQKLKTKNSLESVHLEPWSTFSKPNKKVLEDMENVRAIVSLALEARAKANIKVRQPLASLTVRDKLFTDITELAEVVKDEVNVHEIIINSKLEEPVQLDITITEELQQEGNARDFIRGIQELRKKAKLNPHDVVILSVDTNDLGKQLIHKFKSDIMKTAQLSDIIFSSSPESTGLNQEEIKVDTIIFTIALKV